MCGTTAVTYWPRTFRRATAGDIQRFFFPRWAGVFFPLFYCLLHVKQRAKVDSATVRTGVTGQARGWSSALAGACGDTPSPSPPARPPSRRVHSVDAASSPRLPPRGHQRQARRTRRAMRDTERQPPVRGGLASASATPRPGAPARRAALCRSRVLPSCSPPSATRACFLPVRYPCRMPVLPPGPPHWPARVLPRGAPPCSARARSLAARRHPPHTRALSWSAAPCRTRVLPRSAEPRCTRARSLAVHLLVLRALWACARHPACWLLLWPPPMPARHCPRLSRPDLPARARGVLSFCLGGGVGDGCWGMKSGG